LAALTRRAALRPAFDLDGTLIDARARQVAVAARALAETTGARLDEARFWRLKRAGASTAAAVEALGCAPEIATNVARLWSERIEGDEWLALDRALPGAREVLRRMRGHGAEVVVITARRRADGARRSVSGAELDGLIDHLIVVSPSRAVSEKAAGLRRLRASWFIGDTASDGEAARAAGIRFGAVMTGQRSGGCLRNAGFEPQRSLTAAVRMLDANVSDMSASAPLGRN
jgi:phosphoglycolate phosphatase-like HAD superfamily hydrolase